MKRAPWMFPGVWYVQMLLSSGSVAGDARISGYVRNVSGSGPLSANILVLGTRLATPTDSSGFYCLLNVSPGTYHLRASAVGYVSETIQDFTVTADMSARLDFALKPSDMPLEEIVVRADRVPIEQSRTTSKASFSGEEVLSLPVASFSTVLATAPSAFRGFVRGGHPWFTRSYVDGVDISDRGVVWATDYTLLTPYFWRNRVLLPSQMDADVLTEPVPESVEQASLFAGGYGADYSGLSGVVTYSLREGRGPVSGTARVRVSQLGGLQHLGPNVYNDSQLYYEKKSTLFSDADPQVQKMAGMCSWAPGKYEYGGKPEIQASFGLGGSLLQDVGLYVAGRWFDSHGRLPNEWTRQLTTSAKLTITPDPAIRVNGLLIVEDRGRILGWKNRVYDEFYRYFLEGIPLWDGYSLAGSLKLTHQVSSGVQQDIQVSFTQNNLRRGFCDDNNDGFISPGESGAFLRWEDTAQVYRYMPQYNEVHPDRFFSLFDQGVTMKILKGGYAYLLGYPLLYFEDFTQSALTLSWNGSAIVSRNHVIRGGAEARFHSIGRLVRSSAFLGAFPSYKNYLEDIWKRKPREYSVYLQNTMEMKGLYLNVGIHLRAVDLDAADIADWYAPYVEGTDAAGGPVMVPRRGEPQPVRLLVSPRLGVSHPIRDDASMYFSFSRSQDFLPFTTLYFNYNSWGYVDFHQLTRLSQEPVTTSNYDLGVQWMLHPTTAVTVAAYYKDYQNHDLYRMRAVPSEGGSGTVYFTSTGAMDTRGIEVEIRRRKSALTRFLSVGGTLSYTFSYVKSHWWSGLDNTVFSAAAGDSARYGGQLPFEDWQSYSSWYGHWGGESYILGGRDREHKLAFRLLLEFPYDFRVSALGRFVSGFYYRLTETPDTPDYSFLQGPWNKQVDFRFEKGFQLPGIGRLSVFVDLINAFGWTNVVAMQNTVQGRIAWEKDQDPTGGPPLGQFQSRTGVFKGPAFRSLLDNCTARGYLWGAGYALS